MIDNMKYEELLINSGQSETNNDFIDFCNSIPEIKCLDDLIKFDKIFYNFFSRDATTEKFSRTIIDIFNSKTFSGCSDIGLIVSAILREKGIPTVYVETAKVDWIEKAIKKLPGNEMMEGHIFLEIYIIDTWYLYDPTFHIIYLNYNNLNNNYPRQYYVFAKGMNCNSLGVYNTKDERKLALETITLDDALSYNNPDYEEFNLKNIEQNKI